MDTTKLLIPNATTSIYCSFSGVRSHSEHPEIQFDASTFELVPVKELSIESMLKLNEAAKSYGKPLANGSDLDFLLKNQLEMRVSSVLDTWKGNGEHLDPILFMGTIYNPLTRQCSGDIRKFWFDKNTGVWVETPQCLDHEVPFKDSSRVAFLNI